MNKPPDFQVNFYFTTTPFLIRNSDILEHGTSILGFTVLLQPLAIHQCQYFTSLHDDNFFMSVSSPWALWPIHLRFPNPWHRAWPNRGSRHSTLVITVAMCCLCYPVEDMCWALTVYQALGHVRHRIHPTPALQGRLPLISLFYRMKQSSAGGLNNLQRTQNKLVAEPGNGYKRKVGSLHPNCGSTLLPTRQPSEVMWEHPFPNLRGYAAANGRASVWSWGLADSKGSVPCMSPGSFAV